MEDLFTALHVQGTEQFQNLPEELVGLDLEPEPLSPVNIVASTESEFIKISYDAGEAPAFNKMVGCNFLKEGKNSYYYSELKAKKFDFPEWNNAAPDYVLIIFKKEELDEMMEMFHLPSYTYRDSYQFKDLNTHQYLQFD